MPEHTHTTIPKRFPAFPGHEFWTASRVEKFCRHATPIEYRSGAFILAPDSPPNLVYLIESGQATKYFYSDEGSVVTYSHAGPGDLIGEKGVFIKPTRLFHTIADRNVRAWEISHADFVQLLRDDYELFFWLASKAFSRLDNLERKMLNSALLSAHTRLALTLLELSDREEPNQDGTVSLSVTQQDLSHMLSVSRQTIASCLKDLHCKGILKTKRGQIEISDLISLRQETL